MSMKQECLTHADINSANELNLSLNTTTLISKIQWRIVVCVVHVSYRSVQFLLVAGEEYFCDCT